ncbi:MAG: hypothetical protein JWM58_2698 [Rhizobium sp.]|nr:hypothetical protein [Rhizobium sp.]
MTTKAPPVPPANRSDKGPGEDARFTDNATEQKARPSVGDAAKQGQQGNTAINTTPHLSTQDR